MAWPRRPVPNPRHRDAHVPGLRQCHEDHPHRDLFRHGPGGGWLDAKPGTTGRQCDRNHPPEPRGPAARPARGDRSEPQAAGFHLQFGRSQSGILAQRTEGGSVQAEHPGGGGDGHQFQRCLSGGPESRRSGGRCAHTHRQHGGRGFPIGGQGL